MNRPPAFQFYPKDWFDFKVQRMSLAAQGAYLKLLCFMWTDSKDQCSIPDDNTWVRWGSRLRNGMITARKFNMTLILFWKKKMGV